MSAVKDAQYARVAVDVTRFSVDRPYDYRIPVELEGKLCPGMRVTVPFGRGNSKIEGIVLSLQQEPNYKEPKYILDALEEEPVLTREQIKLALWMRERFFCTVYDAVHAMLPSGMWFKGGKRRVSDKTELFASLLVDGAEALEAAEQKRMRAKQQASILRVLSITGTVSVQGVYWCGNPICKSFGAAGVSGTGGRGKVQITRLYHSGQTAGCHPQRGAGSCVSRPQGATS